MTRDDIIRMALKAGCTVAVGCDAVSASGQKIERFAALVAAAEREACAKVCEELLKNSGHCVTTVLEVTKLYAAAIRARGQA